MPNKLFEYIQSNLAIVCGPLEDAGNLVISNGVGLVTPSTDCEVVANALNQLSRADVDEMRRRAFETGRRINSDEEDAKACQLIQDIVMANRSTSNDHCVAA